MSNKIVIHAHARGRVQGVGFRAAVAFYASKVGLSGTVHNLEDGSVEIFVHGRKDVIESLFKIIQKNFHLIELVQEEITPSRLYNSFEII